MFRYVMNYVLICACLVNARVSPPPLSPFVYVRVRVVA